MIKKIGQAGLVTESRDFTKKADKPAVTQINKEEPPFPQEENLPLSQQILADLSLKDIDSQAELKKEFIIKTLTRALGEKATLSPSFRSLVDKIDAALNDSDDAQRIIANILKSLPHR